jgi:hypothetical protein
MPESTALHMGNDKLYPIVYNEEYGIIAGFWNDRPVLIGFQSEGTLFLWFTDQGDLDTVQFVPFRSPETRQVEELEIKQHVRHERPIRVKQFFIQDHHLGIQDYPSTFQEVLETPSDFDEEEVEDLRKDLKTWERSRQFVLHWNNEYYLNEDGRVVSS